MLKIELGGTDNSDPNNLQFDQLLVANNAALGGELDVSLIIPFALSPQQSFEIIDVGGSLTGTFSGLAEGGFVGNYGGTNLLITYLGGDGNDVTLLSAMPGDFDIDGDVDGFDFLEWQRGKSPFPLSRSDLAAWESNYGWVAPLAATISSRARAGWGIAHGPGHLLLQRSSVVGDASPRRVILLRRIAWRKANWEKRISEWDAQSTGCSSWWFYRWLLWQRLPRAKPWRLRSP